MGYKSILKGGSTSKFEINERVKTPSGMKGVIIGCAEYRQGWVYRVHLDRPGYVKNRYYNEKQLAKVGG